MQNICIEEGGSKSRLAQMKLIQLKENPSRDSSEFPHDPKLGGGAFQDFGDGGSGKNGQLADRYLSHWNFWERNIHSLCKSSRFWNTVISALEVRFNKIELLSLPQYMGLCPTGQCNAMCGFCSVTKNRTGIIKKQLPFDQLKRLIYPVSKTMRMYGLEGNGEPTLYDQFDELFKELTKDGASVYLITNGEKLDSSRIEFMMKRGLNAINFSVNAATPDTHKAVMQLKSFQKVVENIKQCVTTRKEKRVPLISVSMVVTAKNIFEVENF